MKILLHLIATGEYEMYIDPIISSAKRFLAPGEDLMFAVYTDSLKITESSPQQDVFIFKIKHEPWPGPTLKRFHYFGMSRDLIKQTDLSFYIDVDSLFIKEINLQDLGITGGFNGMIGTLHPGFYNTSGTPERSDRSLAFIPHGSNNLYFCGGFFGGSSECFLHAIDQMRNNIDIDLSNDIIAIWHDESHLNKYFFKNPPSCILGIGFACPEERLLKDEFFMSPYIIFLDKPRDLKIKKINHG